jgi:hypothetical protein
MRRCARWVVLLFVLPGTLLSSEGYLGMALDTRAAPLYHYLDTLYCKRSGRIDIPELYTEGHVDSFYCGAGLPYPYWNWESWWMHMIPIKTVYKVDSVVDGVEYLTPIFIVREDSVEILRQSRADSLTWRALLGTTDYRYKFEKADGIEWGSWPPRDDSLWKNYLEDTVLTFLDNWRNYWDPFGVHISGVEIWNEPFNSGYQKHVVYPFYNLFLRNPDPEADTNSFWFSDMVDSHTGSKVKLWSIHTELTVSPLAT